MAYSLLGIFNIFMPLIYSEGRENIFKRLWEYTAKALKGNRLALVSIHLYSRLILTGPYHEDYSVTFSLSNTPEI